jgi:hypothetical protein
LSLTWIEGKVLDELLQTLGKQLILTYSRVGRAQPHRGPSIQGKIGGVRDLKDFSARKSISVAKFSVRLLQRIKCLGLKLRLT